MMIDGGGNMELYDILKWISVFFFVVILAIVFYVVFHRKRLLKKATIAIQEAIGTVEITPLPNQLIRFEHKDRLFLVKLISMNPKHELILTNPTFWCINDNPNTWKRSSTPVLIPFVKEFLNLSLESEKEVVKVAMIIPGCYNITRYLNESDVELVTYKKSVHGVTFVRFDEIKDFLSSN